MTKKLDNNWAGSVVVFGMGLARPEINRVQSVQPVLRKLGASNASPSARRRARYGTEIGAGARAVMKMRKGRKARPRSLADRRQSPPGEREVRNPVVAGSADS